MPTGILRKPRCWVKSNGATIPVLECTVIVHTTQSSDTFTAAFPIDAQGVDVGYWANPTAQTTITATNDASQGGTVDLIVGGVDKVSIDWAERYIYIEGQDLSSTLKRTLTREDFKNKTPKVVISDIVGRHGLASNVDDSGHRTGRHYTTDHDEVTSQQSEWTLIAQMAEREGKVLFFKNGTLYFKDPTNLNQGMGTIAINYTAPTRQQYAKGNFVGLVTSRHCDLSNQTQVSVSSYHPHTNKTSTATRTMSATQAGVGTISTSPLQFGVGNVGSFGPAAAGLSSSGAGTGSINKYTYEVPRLEQPQVDAIADKKILEVTDHEQEIRLDRLPGDVNADPRQTLTLSGTNTIFDQSYRIESITHNFNQQEYTMDIHAKASNASRSVSSGADQEE